jgi:hypothetical protein
LLSQIWRVCWRIVVLGHLWTVRPASAGGVQETAADGKRLAHELAHGKPSRRIPTYDSPSRKPSCRKCPTTKTMSSVGCPHP